MEKEAAEKINSAVNEVTGNEKEEAEDLLTQAVRKAKAAAETIKNELKG